jgi:hypothetical protein
MTLEDAPSQSQLVPVAPPHPISVPLEGGIGDYTAQVGDTCCCFNRSGRDYKRISIWLRGTSDRRSWAFDAVHPVPSEPGVYILKACWFAVDDNHTYAGTHGTLTVTAPNRG